MFPAEMAGWRKKKVVYVVDPGMGLQMGGRRAGFFLASRVFCFFSMLHHPEPNRAMLVGVGVAATVSGQLVPQRKRVLFCNYKITIVDLVRESYRKPVWRAVLHFTTAHCAGVGSCPLFLS